MLHAEVQVFLVNVVSIDSCPAERRVDEENKFFKILEVRERFEPFLRCTLTQHNLKNPEITGNFLSIYKVLNNYVVFIPEVGRLLGHLTHICVITPESYQIDDLQMVQHHQRLEEKRMLIDVQS
jgi:hypothetical protein